MLATAITSIEHDFSTNLAIGAKLVAALYLASAIAQPVLGRTADMIGPRRVLIGGMILVAISAILGYVAATVPQLLITRVMLGIGTAAGYPAALAIIQQKSIQLGGAASPRILAAIAIVGNVSVALGPVVGGALVAIAGWRATILINLPFACVAAVLVLALVRSDTERRVSIGAFLRQADIIGIVLFGAAMGALLIFLMRVKLHADARILAAATLLFGTLIWFEARTARPFLDVRMLAKNRPLLRVYAKQMLVFLSGYVFFYSLPQWIQESRHLNAFVSGILLLPMSIAAAAIAWVLAGRSSAIQVRVGGCAMLACSGLIMIMNSDTSPILVVFMAIALGVSTGAITQANQQGLIRYAPEGTLGVAAGMFRTAQYCGAMLSTGISAWVFIDGVTDSSLHTAAILLLPAGTAVFLLGFLDVEKPHRTV